MNANPLMGETAMGPTLMEEREATRPYGVSGMASVMADFGLTHSPDKEGYYHFTSPTLASSSEAAKEYGYNYLRDQHQFTRGDVKVHAERLPGPSRGNLSPYRVRFRLRHGRIERLAGAAGVSGPAGAPWYEGPLGRRERTWHGEAARTVPDPWYNEHEFTDTIQDKTLGVGYAFITAEPLISGYGGPRMSEAKFPYRSGLGHHKGNAGKKATFGFPAWAGMGEFAKPIRRLTALF